MLHTHLVIANRVQGPDGRWTALDGRDVYRHRLAADAIYRHLPTRPRPDTRSRVDTSGHPRQPGAQGLPEDLIRLFSKRTSQIDAELGRLAADGRGADTAAGQVDRPGHPQAQAV